MNLLRQLIVNQLRHIANLVENDECTLTDEEAEELLSAISHKVISKQEAIDELNISRATFDKKVKDKELPKGKKRRGWSGLYWFKDEIIKFKNK